MTTLTLPLVAGAPFDGRAWFAARTIAEVDPAETATVWLDRPELTDAAMRWSRDDEVKSPHVRLDLATVAELLFVSTLEPSDGPTDTLLCDVVTRQLAACHCNLTACPSRASNEFGDHPERAVTRMLVCLEWAARIVRTEATS